MNKKYTAIAALMTLMIAITLTIVGSSYAASNNSDTKTTFMENQTKMQDAIKNNDFTSWKSLMEANSKGRFAQKVTQENFDNMVTTQKIQSDIKTTITNADYSAWKTAVAKSKNGAEMLKAIDTEAEFKTFVEAHKLVEEGQAKMKQGHDKMTELGIKKLGMSIGSEKFGGMKGGSMRGGMMKEGFGMMKNGQ